MKFCELPNTYELNEKESYWLRRMYLYKKSLVRLMKHSIRMGAPHISSSMKALCTIDINNLIMMTNFFSKAKNNDKGVVTSFCPFSFVKLKTMCALPLVIFCLSLSLEPYGEMQDNFF
jgi:hypothetical protein